MEARVRIGEKGAVETIQTKGSDPNLSLEVEGYLKKRAQFSPDCQRKEVRLLFTFRLEGEPRENPFIKVAFRPPNHFIITSQRGVADSTGSVSRLIEGTQRE